MSVGDVVNLVEGHVPEDYHCHCEFCQRAIGELRPPGDAGYYSRLERRQYYDKSENNTAKGGHVAKTPLHVARWAIQTYTRPGDWVLDPTIGAGTTAVEAITQGRHVAGMEVQYADVLRANIKKARDTAKPLDTTGLPPYAKIKIGDARRIGKFLDDMEMEDDLALVVNNPPYSGDEHANMGGDGKMGTATYNEGLPNLAFLREGAEYFDAIAAIYVECAKRLRPDGHFVTGIKDMMRAKKPLMLHQKICEVLRDRVGLVPVGTAFLKHNPTTLFLNTYHKRYGVHPPYYQTISVFRKGSR